MTNIPVASGLCYEDQYDIVEKVAKMKANQYKRIGFYDAEDLKQEVRIKCWSVMDRYNPACGANLFVFLSTCAENRLRDIRRSVMYKHNKPCFRCPFWNAGASASGIHDCLVYNNKMDCNRFAKHERYVHAKLSACHPVDIDTQRIEDRKPDSHQKRLEIVELIESRLPKHLSAIFIKFKRDNFNIKVLNTREKALLLKSLKSIVDISDFY